MSKVFMPRPIDQLVVLGLGQSCQSWAALMARQPGFKGEVWTLNAGILAFRHDVGFDMHTEEYVHGQLKDELMVKVLERWKFYETHNKPIVMPRVSERFPTSEAFPLQMVVNTLKSDYFQNGMAYMLAMALLCKPKLLYLLGSDWSYENPEGQVFREDGRACVEYWLGRLTEAGCEVAVTDKSPVLGADERNKDHRIYGYHEKIKRVVSEDGRNAMLMIPDYTVVE